MQEIGVNHQCDILLLLKQPSQVLINCFLNRIFIFCVLIYEQQTNGRQQISNSFIIKIKKVHQQHCEIIIHTEEFNSTELFGIATIVRSRSNNN